MKTDQELGPCKIIDRLGSRGTGEVCKQFDRRLDRYVAPRVSPEATVTNEFRPRFIREARASVALNHPSIATIYEVGQIGGTCYVSMEYIEEDRSTVSAISRY